MHTPKGRLPHIHCACVLCVQVDVKGYGEGTVIGYQKQRVRVSKAGVKVSALGQGLHYIGFDISGTARMKLSYKSMAFKVSSHKFVDEFIDIRLAEFDAEQAGVMQKAEEVALKSAMKVPAAWCVACLVCLAHCRIGSRLHVIVF